MRPDPDLELSTRALNQLVAHNEGDLTAVLQAGLAMEDAQAAFAEHGQRLSLDPPNPGGQATVGGIVATADSGPLRHRFGAVRDLVLGVRIALPDGTVARAGSNVIKNVAGYDLGKLMCGAFGTLGVVTEVTVRLHPLPARTVTVTARGGDLRTLCDAAADVAALPLELEALDLRWDGPDAGGAVLASAAGSAPAEVAAAAASVATARGLDVDIATDGDFTWTEQRERQRARPGEAVLRVSALPSALVDVLGAAPSGVARAGLGLAWLRIPADVELVRRLRVDLAPAPCVLLDAPLALKSGIDPWGAAGPAVELARRVKQRFDPARVCNPGILVGGI